MKPNNYIELIDTGKFSVINLLKSLKYVKKGLDLANILTYLKRLGKVNIIGGFISEELMKKTKECKIIDEKQKEFECLIFNIEYYDTESLFEVLMANKKITDLCSKIIINEEEDYIKMYLNPYNYKSRKGNLPREEKCRFYKF